MTSFRNRYEAGKILGEKLQEKDIEADLVLAIPRGGLPVARPVADLLNAELDVVVAKKIGAPYNPELAIGAVASNGSYWLNRELIDRVDVDDEYIRKEIDRQSKNAKEKLEFMRGTKKPINVEGLKVVVVDDGIATGSTAIACLRQLKYQGVKNLVFAAPVGPVDTEKKLSGECDKIFLIEKPVVFSAVGAFYNDFTQVSDEEARQYLGK